MSLIKIIETGIDPSLFLNELRPEDWLHNTNRQDRIEFQKHTQTIHLIAVRAEGEDQSLEKLQNANEICSTPLTCHYPKSMEWLKARFPEPYNWLQATAFVKLLPGKEVYPHVDNGEYYKTRDRYHLALQGRYRFSVVDESIVVEPGTLFWFNNKRQHWAENLEDEDRIAVIFDVFHYELPDNNTVRR